MITTLVLMSRMPKKLIAVPLPPPPPPNEVVALAPNATPAPPALIMVRGALSGVLISGSRREGDLRQAGRENALRHGGRCAD